MSARARRRASSRPSWACPPERALRAAGTRRPHRRRVDRPGPPGAHPRRPRRRGEGAVPRRRRGHRRPTSANAALIFGSQASPHPRARPRTARVRIAELRDRVLSEELDYRREAANQRLLAAYYDGHPTIHIPQIIEELSGRRVVTSELSDGARFAELAGWPQEERDLAAETIYRFVFRSLYEAHAFNGDPHPGNYLFHGGGRVTFLDFGLVKHFTLAELQPLMQMARQPVRGQPARGVPPRHGGRRVPGPARAAEHRDDRRSPGRLLRHHPPAGPPDHHPGLRLGRRAPLLRPAQPGGRGT